MSRGFIWNIKKKETNKSWVKKGVEAEVKKEVEVKILLVRLYQS